MVDVVVYSGPNCPFCLKAKTLLKLKGVAFTEYNVKADVERMDEMVVRSNGRRTIPQIFINNQHVGGCDDLYALNESGKLDPLLAG